MASPAEEYLMPECTHCGGSGFDSDPELALDQGACHICQGSGREPCIICGDTGYDINTGMLVTCACRIERKKHGNTR